MKSFLRLLPDGASTMAGRVDALFYFLCAISILVAGVIAVLVMYFAVRYRRKPGEDATPYRGVGLAPADMKRMEILWIAGPLVVFMLIFWWGAKLFAAMATPPDDAMQIYVVGKQWMWKVQHLGGRREINELHVPVGAPIKLTMTSEDVIHSFYIPAFRVKNDVLPGRYSTLWFEATEVGEYHLFCAEYCGTNHSRMVGKIVVMEPRDFQLWLGGGAEGSLAEAGEKLFSDLGCNTCHSTDSRVPTGSDKDRRGPPLAGVFGSTVRLQNGDEVLADEGYLRESILEPQKKVLAGYQPVMPTYVAQLNEEKVIQLIAYIRALRLPAQPTPKGPSAAGGEGGRPTGAGGGADQRGAGGKEQP